MLKRIFLLIIGVLLLVNAVLVAVMTSFNAGWVIEGVIGTVFLLYAILWNRLTRIKAINVIVAIILVLIILGAMFVAVYGSIDTAEHNEKAIIVLGAGIRGETVTTVLAARLDKALEFYNERGKSEFVIVVSGGQGQGESISEAEAMGRYLIYNGVHPLKIYREPDSTSTYENLKFSKALLDELFNEPYEIAVVTNNFHVFRAEMIARYCGFETVEHLGAYTELYLLPAYCLRELPAILAETISEIIGAVRN
ncbi:MAG: YdcF family protein [Oscillospiraceae bacterium]|jgi:uncharacterized SAM-binding protein YcdF (DUF218 family)|nr:YdcF family protein [Oscillospiraceae bacterium]